MMIKSIRMGNRTIINVCIPNIDPQVNEAINDKIEERNRQIIVADFNTPILIDRITR